MELLRTSDHDVAERINQEKPLKQMQSLLDGSLRSPELQHADRVMEGICSSLNALGDLPANQITAQAREIGIPDACILRTMGGYSYIGANIAQTIGLFSFPSRS